MKKLLCLLVALMLTFSAVGFAAPGNKLGMEALRALYDGENNCFVSPVSLDLALALTAYGAQGDTKAEILAALEAEDTETAYRFIPALRQSGLKIANAAFVNDRIALREEFASGIRRDLDAGIFPLDSAESIHEWVSEHTGGLIDKIPLDDNIGQTALVLINAIAMDAKWEEPFDPYYTRKMDFRAPGGDTQVEMMRSFLYTDFYAEIDGIRFLRLNYRDCRLYMLLALPDEGVGLSDVLDWLTENDPDAIRYEPESAAHIISAIVERNKGWSSELSESEIEWLSQWYIGSDLWEISLRLPKFDITCDYDLTETLKAKGVTTAFTPKAQFPGISETPLMLMAVKQKLRVQVDEEGTRAAAVTWAELNDGATDPRYERVPVDFFCDRPFVMLIVDGESGAICFAGVVTDPLS